MLALHLKTFVQSTRTLLGKKQLRQIRYAFMKELESQLRSKFIVVILPKKNGKISLLLGGHILQLIKIHSLKR